MGKTWNGGHHEKGTVIGNEAEISILKKIGDNKLGDDCSLESNKIQISF